MNGGVLYLSAAQRVRPAARLQALAVLSICVLIVFFLVTAIATASAQEEELEDLNTPSREDSGHPSCRFANQPPQTAPVDATEKAVLELLQKGNCQAALIELRRASLKAQKPRLSLYYARAYCQCGSFEGMETAYKTVLATSSQFAAEELEEAHHALRNDSAGPVQRRTVQTSRSSHRGAVALVVIGSILLIPGIGMTAAGAATSSDRTADYGPIALMVSGLGVFAVPGAIMLGFGIKQW